MSAGREVGSGLSFGRTRGVSPVFVGEGSDDEGWWGSLLGGVCTARREKGERRASVLSKVKGKKEKKKVRVREEEVSSEQPLSTRSQNDCFRGRGIYHQTLRIILRAVSSIPSEKEEREGGDDLSPARGPSFIVLVSFSASHSLASGPEWPPIQLFCLPYPSHIRSFCEDENALTLCPSSPNPTRPPPPPPPRASSLPSSSPTPRHCYRRPRAL